MKASTLFINSKEDLYTTSQENLDNGSHLGYWGDQGDQGVMEDERELISPPSSSSLPFSPPKSALYAAKQWFFKTPERALNEAYNTALTIKSIEDEYFNGKKISTDSTDCSDLSEHLMSFVRADFQKELMIAKLRLAEFKASSLVLSIPVSAHLDKLSFLDEVLAKYVSEPNPSVGSAPVSPVEKSASKLMLLSPVGKSASNQFNGLPASVTDEVDSVKTTFFGVTESLREQVPVAKPQSPTQAQYPNPNPSSALGTATTLGLAFGVGLVVGGVGTWTLLSAENPAANNDNHQRSAEEMYPHRAVAQTNSTDVKLSVSIPETTLPDFSL